MVLIHCKRLPREEHSKDFDEFLYSTPNTTNVGEATDAVQKMQNFRVRLKWMVAAARQLAKDSCPEEMKHCLEGPAGDAERYLALDRVDQKLATTMEELQTLADTMKGGVVMVFPEQCSGTDHLQKLTAKLDDESVSDVDRSTAHRILSIVDDGAVTEDIIQGTLTMWWSGKPLARDVELSKYTGKNDKTKIVVKLTKEGGSAPPREAVVDAKTQSELMAHYFRKQEEEKKLVEDDDITYGNSAWADSRGLKSQLLGMGGVKFKSS
jgi:cilia- and flagella-associated protein 298